MSRYDRPNFDFENFRRRVPPRFNLRLALLALVLLVAAVALLTSFYTVDPEGQAVVKRFGAVVRMTEPGLHLKWPLGIETQTFVPTRRVLKEEFGFRTIRPGQRTQYGKGTPEKQVSLMLTGDLNVIDVEWVVQYTISDPDRWLHQVRDPRETLRDVSESVMRRVVGNTLGSAALTEARPQIAEEVRIEMQAILDDGAPGGDDYDMGVRIGSVEMQDVTPPDPVKPAFNEVNKARQEKERLINEAEKRRNQLIPRARGEAQQTVSEAEAYAAERTNAARGEAARFTAILAEYEKVPQVARQRMFLETMDEVLPKLGKMYIIDPSGGGPLELLNLDGKGGVR